MGFRTPYTTLPLPVNYDPIDHRLFDKINDWKKVEDESSKTIENVKVTYEGYFMRGFTLHPDSFFGKPNQNIGLKERLKIYSAPINEKINIATWCTDPWGNGYYHFIVDTLQRYYSIERESNSVTLLLPYFYQNLSFVSEILDSLNINCRFINKDEVVKIKNLYLPAFIKPRGTCNPDHISILANHFREMPFISSEKRKKVYISRRKALRRKIHNENEVIKLMIDYGIHVLYMEELNWVEQAKIMANTDLLISLHGAGLTNMIIMPRNSKVVEIRMDTGYNQVCYYELAGALGHDYYYNKARPYSINDSPGYGNCTVDLQKLEALIKQIL